MFKSSKQRSLWIIEGSTAKYKYLLDANSECDYFVSKRRLFDRLECATVVYTKVAVIVGTVVHTIFGVPVIKLA